MPNINSIKIISKDVDDFGNRLSKLDIMLSSTNKADAQNALQYFEELLDLYPLNPLVLIRFVTFIQLIDDEAVFSKFPLDEVEVVLQKLSSLYASDLDLNIEYLFFLQNVQDKEYEASVGLQKLKSSVESKLSTLLKSINEK